jgi:3',5'-cyclic AMP phosphodiesterase CpdA
MDWGVHGESTNVVHLTGLRLFADEARTDARGVAPAAAVAAVLRAAAASVVKPPPAAIVITGDVAADRSAGAYALAKRLVRAAFPTTPVLFLPG